MARPKADAAELLQLISDVNRRLVFTLEAHLRPSGLSIEQFRVLDTLARQDGRPMGELAAKVGVDSPTLTKIIDRMIDNALVYRAPDSRDRRRVLVFRSERGAALLADIEADLRACQRDLVGHLGPGEAAQLRTILQSFVPPA